MPEQDDVSLELYKTAYSRLNFQDEYLFKFSALFMTINGALGLSMSKLAEAPTGTILLISSLGFIVSLIWALWIRQNDYWHSVWTGALRKLEADLPGEAELFNVDAKAMAGYGRRSSRLVFRGARIAICIPASLMVVWIVILVNYSYS